MVAWRISQNTPNEKGSQSAETKLVSKVKMLENQKENQKQYLLLEDVC